MFDLFNRRKVRELEAALAAEKASVVGLRTDISREMDLAAQYRNENHSLRKQVDFLVRTIRKIDDIIFSISQCSDWTIMRPRVAQLTEEMIARKVAESNKINDVVTAAIKDTYKPTPKQIGTR